MNGVSQLVDEGIGGLEIVVQVVERRAFSVMCNSSIASFRAIIIVTLASSTANGLMSMPKNWRADTKPNII